MLVLSREVDEEIVLVLPDGREISVMVVDLQGDKARIGIQADRDIRIHRKEIWREICAESTGMRDVGNGTGEQGIQGPTDARDVSGPGDTRPVDLQGR